MKDWTMWVHSGNLQRVELDEKVWSGGVYVFSCTTTRCWNAMSTHPCSDQILTYTEHEGGV